MIIQHISVLNGLFFIKMMLTTFIMIFLGVILHLHVNAVGI